MCLNNILLTFLYSFNLLLFLFFFCLPSLELIEYFYDSTLSLLLTYDSLFYFLVAAGFIIYTFNQWVYFQVISYCFTCSARSLQRCISRSSFSFYVLFFKAYVIFLFIYFRLCWAFLAVPSFLYLKQAGATLRCCVRASHQGSLSWAARALRHVGFGNHGTWAKELWSLGCRDQVQ